MIALFLAIITIEGIWAYLLIAIIACLVFWILVEVICLVCRVLAFIWRSIFGSTASNITHNAMRKFDAHDAGLDDLLREIERRTQR